MEFQLNASTWFRLCNRHDSLNLISAVPHEMRTISFLFLLLYYFLFGGHITSMTLEISFHSLNLTLRACNLILYCFQSLSRSSSFLNHFQSIKRGRVSLSLPKKVIEIFCGTIWTISQFQLNVITERIKKRRKNSFLLSVNFMCRGWQNAIHHWVFNTFQVWKANRLWCRKCGNEKVVRAWIKPPETTIVIVGINRSL